MCESTERLNTFEKWFNKTYTLEERMTDPSLKANVYSIWYEAFIAGNAKGYDNGYKDGFKEGGLCALRKL